MNWLRRRSPLVGALRTARLDLVPITPALLDTEASSLPRLGGLLEATVPESWPPQHWEPHVRAYIVLQSTECPATLGWHRYMVRRQAGAQPSCLVGCVGGFPKDTGEIEIGYSTLPDFQRNGYATEAARALVDWLLVQQGVEAVTAQTYESLPESIKVMERCGMQPAGAGDEPGTVRYRRSR